MHTLLLSLTSATTRTRALCAHPDSSFFPTGPRQTCDYLVNEFGADLIRLVDAGLSPDAVCHGLHLCTDTQCKLHPNRATASVMKKAAASSGAKARARATVFSGAAGAAAASGARSGENPWKWLEKLLLAVARHQPEIDLDGDGFSVEPVLRGSNWRGRDCSPLDKHVYPGRASNPNGASTADYNCNGIGGTAPSGKSYEEELCAGTQHLGVMAIGDSAGAHFEIPPSYMNASEINKHTYHNLLYLLADEFDRPLRSGYTGFVNTSAAVPVQSVYKYMREHNRCIHRDFQNLCVNGARSGAVTPILETMSRNNKTDHPALVFFELIGNDVCNPHEGTSHMTTVPEFRRNVMQALRQLDNQLPAGSTVVTVDLADGLVLWDSLHNRTHPIGVTYEVVYSFLNCLNLSPCRGWMNRNE